MDSVSLLNYHLNNSPLAVIEWDAQFRVKKWSTMAERIFGWKHTEVINLYPLDWSFVHVDDRPRVSQAMGDLLAKKVTRNISFNRNYTRDGRVIYCEWYNSLLFLENGELLSVLSLVLEVTKKITLEREKAKQQELIETTLQLLNDAVIVTDRHYQITYLNPQATEITGYSYEQAQGLPLSKVFSLNNHSIEQAISNYVNQGLGLNSLLSFDSDYRLNNSSGKELDIEFTAIATYNNYQCLKGYVLIFNDGKNHNSLIGKLKYQAEKDTLTGLFNRLYFERQLAKAISSVSNSDNSHCLCYLDLDRFQIVNDTCGHAAGDQLLQQVAVILEQQLGDLAKIARLGGDEFAILLLNHKLNTALILIQELRDRINQFDFVWEEAVLRINASFGLVEINRHSPNFSIVLSAADAACFTAKETGRNKIQIYSQSDNLLQRMKCDRQWTTKIKEAIEHQQFCLYQQKIEPAQSTTSDTCMYEILVRMLDTDGNLIPPLNFIPIAERYGLMCDLDLLVVKMLIEYLQQPRFSDHHYLVNLSATTIGNLELLSYLQQLCTSKIIKPQSICFEITETATISNFTLAVNFIKELKEMGFQFALDDFGSGMSSFTYLQSLPVDYIKIDGSFVKNMLNNDLNYTIIESIQKIAQILKIKTIAEFVESQEIRSQLINLGIDYFQGYAIAKVYPLNNL